MVLVFGADDEVVAGVPEAAGFEGVSDELFLVVGAEPGPAFGVADHGVVEPGAEIGREEINGVGGQGELDAAAEEEELDLVHLALGLGEADVAHGEAGVEVIGVHDQEAGLVEGLDVAELEPEAGGGAVSAFELFLGGGGAGREGDIGGGDIEQGRAGQEIGARVGLLAVGQGVVREGGEDEHEGARLARRDGDGPGLALIAIHLNPHLMRPRGHGNPGRGAGLDLLAVHQHRGPLRLGVDHQLTLDRLRRGRFAPGFFLRVQTRRRQQSNHRGRGQGQAPPSARTFELGSFHEPLSSPLIATTPGEEGQSG